MGARNGRGSRNVEITAVQQVLTETGYHNTSGENGERHVGNNKLAEKSSSTATTVFFRVFGR
jgi:hypothetical protein